MRTITSLLAVALLAVGCGDQTVAPDPLPAGSEVYWELVLSQHAVLMSTVAPYDTLTVTATPRNVEHVPLPGFPAPTYTSTKPDKVNVLANGTIVVVDTTAEPVAIIAALTIHNLKHTDTLRVIAVDSAHPVVLDTLSIHPVAPDSAKFSISFDRPIRVRALAPGGTPIPIYRQDFPGIVPVAFVSQDPAKIQALSSSSDINHQPPFGFAAAARGVALGTSTLIASTMVFGVPKADTAVYRVGLPIFLQNLVSHGDQYSGTNDASKPIVLPHPEITIATGGAIAWSTFVSGNPIDTVTVTFDDAALPGVAAPAPVVPFLEPFVPRFFLCGFTDDCTQSGNFVLSPDNMFAARYFPVAGTYEYLFTSNSPGGVPARGRIIVVDETSTP